MTESSTSRLLMSRLMILTSKLTGFNQSHFDARQERTAQGNLRWLCQTPISRATSTPYTTRPGTTPRRRLPKPTIQVVQYPIFVEQETNICRTCWNLYKLTLNRTRTRSTMSNNMEILNPCLLCINLLEAGRRLCHCMDVIERRW